MNEQVLKNLLVFLNRASEAGAIKNSLDALAFAEAFQQVSALLAAVQAPPAPPAAKDPA